MPRTVATSVAIAPIWIEVTSDSHTPGAPHGFCQCLSVGPAAEFHVMFDFV